MTRPGVPAGHSRRAALRILSLLPLALSGRTAGADTQAVGAVLDVRGIAVAELGTDRRSLAVRSPVHPGETLSTGDRSRLKALFARNATLSLRANPRLTNER